MYYFLPNWSDLISVYYKNFLYESLEAVTYCNFFGSYADIIANHLTLLNYTIFVLEGNFALIVLLKELIDILLVKSSLVKDVCLGLLNIFLTEEELSALEWT